MRSAPKEAGLSGRGCGGWPRRGGGYRAAVDGNTEVDGDTGVDGDRVFGKTCSTIKPFFKTNCF